MMYPLIMMSRRVLVVDDDIEIVRTARAYLEQAGFEVLVAYDGKAALAEYRRQKPDLLVLDLMLPEVDGLDVARAVRRESDVPIIMLTARVEEADRLIGLELGADDYMTKPFSPRELVARARAVLRRAQGEPAKREILSSRGVVLDRAGHTVAVNAQSIDLTPTEFTLLEVLMENAGRVMTRLQLIEKALGYSYEGYDRTVDAHIKNLRRKIEADPAQPLHILTVFGVGYKFAGPQDAG